MQICPESTKALNFVDHNLSHSSREAYAMHIRECEECINTINQMKEDFTLIEFQIPVKTPEKSTAEEYQHDLRDRLKALYSANEDGIKEMRKVKWRSFLGEKIQRFASVTGIF